MKLPFPDRVRLQRFLARWHGDPTGELTGYRDAVLAVDGRTAKRAARGKDIDSLDAARISKSLDEWDGYL
jgi:hypothetical protein